MLDWRALKVTSGDRSAIFSEAFPAALTWALALFPEALNAFDQAAALDVLVEFADRWLDLPHDPTGNGRIVVRGLPGPDDRVVVIVFYAVEIAAGQVVITDVGPFHH